MSNTILAFDIGEVRTGVARAYVDVRIASPLVTLDDASNLSQQIARLVDKEQAEKIVVGLPRNLNGDDTQQTKFVRETVEKIQDVISVPVVFIDEALTSVKAEKELSARKKPYTKADIDMLSATYILEDYLETSGLVERRV